MSYYAKIKDVNVDKGHPLNNSGDEFFRTSPNSVVFTDLARGGNYAPPRTVNTTISTPEHIEILRKATRPSNAELDEDNAGYLSSKGMGETIRGVGLSGWERFKNLSPSSAASVAGLLSGLTTLGYNVLPTDNPPPHATSNVLRNIALAAGLGGGANFIYNKYLRRNNEHENH